ncbi:hypothetical protein ACEUCS_19940 [Aeromonas caviae]|uniref:hypothetical protein n=1 Tax=Aeromonas TaxID=642 RepID=UPI0013726766|nr:hypothetical protein [Aeromonas caviae]MBL0551164.1 hypothetical protein [Aeromonas caviae]MCR3984761.1 hypothetical protein [Aeromonas caviae]MDH0357997.1 hypothetical protein [Aeromonas caviae]MDX7812549.1 hypothetical protein [Aeromonas caviae]MDX7817053.1 hypothetical protein [Aeromonas caviae]
MTSFEIISSRKSGLHSRESYIVICNKVVFLRILGENPQWELMTATASEDDGLIKVCNNRPRLVQAAWRLGVEINTRPVVKSDWKDREYVSICVIDTKNSTDVDAARNEIDALLSRFFELYDSYQSAEMKGTDDMRELYDALAIDGNESDVYLSDGVWLSKDGSMHDRGR